MKDEPKEYARGKGWLARTPQEIKRIEEKERLAAEKKRQERDKKLAELFDNIDWSKKRKR
jgi:hypothetical protein